MLSLGMFSFLAARIAVRRRGFESGSPPPTRAAMGISRMTLVKARPRLASVAAFLCLIVAHLECPDMEIASSVIIWGLIPDSCPGSLAYDPPESEYAVGSSGKTRMSVSIDGGFGASSNVGRGFFACRADTISKYG